MERWISFNSHVVAKFRLHMLTWVFSRAGFIVFALIEVVDWAVFGAVDSCCQAFIGVVELGDLALCDTSDVRGERGGAPQPLVAVAATEAVGETTFSGLPMSGRFRPCCDPPSESGEDGLESGNGLVVSAGSWYCASWSATAFIRLA